MLAIKGIFDGAVIKPLEPVPCKEEMEVIITFLTDFKKTKKRRNWRDLKGSVQGENLLDALLQERQEDLNREG